MRLVYRELLNSAVRSLRSGWNPSERSAFWYGVSAEAAEQRQPLPVVEQAAKLREFENTGQGQETSA